MRMTVNQPAGPGEHFAADAFASQVGRTVPVNVGGGRVVDGQLLAADVAADGRSVELTLDVDVAPGAFGPPGPASLRFA